MSSVSVAIEPGLVVGKLTVRREATRGPRGVSWICDCECGIAIVLSTFNLTVGGYKSCGCGRDTSRRPITVSRELVDKYRLTVVSWKAMWARCRYAIGYKGKGITVCEEWYSFEKFLYDMGERPSKEHSIDRRDPDKGYYKDNCRWITKIENCSRIRLNLSPERNRKISETWKIKRANGWTVSEESRAKIANGGATRAGRKMQKCVKCGRNSYLLLCQKCGGRKRNR